MTEQKNDLLNNTPASEKTPVVVNSVKLDPENPLPFDYGSDSFYTAGGKRYIPFLGQDDNIPNTFWELRAQSTTHNACIGSIAECITAKGLYVKNFELEKVDKEFLAWINTMNRDRETINDITKEILECLQTDGNAFVEIVKGEVGSRKYVKVYVHTTLRTRLKEENEDGEVTAVLISDQFARKRNGMLTSRQLKATEIPLYNFDEVDKNAVWKKNEKTGDLHTVIHLKTKFSAVPHYGLPRSLDSIRYQALEGKAAQYNIDNFDNNMVLSALLIFKSSMTQAEAQKNAKQIVKTHTGQGKTGRVGVVSSEGGIEDFEYKTMDVQKEGSFIELDKRVEQKIITSHKWDSVLAGISRDSAFGNGSQYVRAVFDIKKEMVLQPLALYLLKNFIQPLMNIAIEHLGKKEWGKYELDYRLAMPFSLISDIDVNSVLTKDEGRGILGYAAHKEPAKGAEFIKSQPAKNVSDKPAV